MIYPTPARYDDIDLTWDDYHQKFGLPAPIVATQRAAQLPSGTEVVAVRLREATADLAIDFAGGLCLEVIPNSSGYESWQIRAPGGIYYVAQGGGQICTWTQ